MSTPLMKERRVLWVVIGLCLINDGWTAAGEGSTLTVLIVSRATYITNKALTFQHPLVLFRSQYCRYYICILQQGWIYSLQAPLIHFLCKFDFFFFFKGAQCEVEYDSACLLRMLNMLTIVTKIVIQILCSLSQLFFFFFSHSCCGAGEEEDELMAGENGRSFCFLPFPICWTFWGLAESVHAWQVWLLSSVHDVCATLSVCQHTPAPPASIPGTGTHSWKGNELRFPAKWQKGHTLIVLYLVEMLKLFVFNLA